MSEPEAENVASIRRWLTKCRPDMLPQLEHILRLDRDGNEGGTAMLALLTIGWGAGREHQIELMKAAGWRPPLDEGRTMQ